MVTHLLLIQLQLQKGKWTATPSMHLKKKSVQLFLNFCLHAVRKHDFLDLFRHYISVGYFEELTLTPVNKVVCAITSHNLYNSDHLYIYFRVPVITAS